MGKYELHKDMTTTELFNFMGQDKTTRPQARNVKL